MDELELLRKIRNDIPIAKDSVIDGGREQLLQRITPGAKKKRKPRRTALRIGLTSVATLGLATALVAGNVVGLAGWRGGASAEAAEVLNSAAELTIKTSDPVVNPGQYLKIESTNLWSTEASEATAAGEADPNKNWIWLDTEKMSMYIPADRNDEWVWKRSGRIPTTFFDEGSKNYALSQAKSMGDTSELLRAPKGAFYDQESSFPDADELAAYSRNPRVLLNGIYKSTLGSGQSIDGEALVYIADLLRTGLVPADLRAALYKAAAMIPGVTIAEDQATLDGQKGIAIGRVEDVSHLRQDIIIDPLTGQLIGERQVMTQEEYGFPAGTAIAWTTIRTTVVDSAP